MWIRHYPKAPAKSKGQLNPAGFLCCKLEGLKSKLRRAGGSGAPWWEQGWVGLAPAGPELSPLPCLAGTSLPPLLPQPCTIQYLVTHYLDISCVPRRSFFELLSYFSTNELEREKLQEFSSAQGQEELYSYCNRPRRTTLEVRLGAGQGCPIRADLGLKASRTPSAEEFNVFHPFYDVSMDFHQQLRAALDHCGFLGGLCAALGGRGQWGGVVDAQVILCGAFGHA